jgi:hypothetical protein
LRTLDAKLQQADKDRKSLKNESAKLKTKLAEAEAKANEAEK